MISTSVALLVSMVRTPKGLLFALECDDSTASLNASVNATIVKGLGKTESIPAVIARNFASLLQLAEEQMMGNIGHRRHSSSHSLKSLVASIPSMMGICKSIITKSRSSHKDFIFSSPSAPSFAVFVVCPEPFNLFDNIFTTAIESSIIRMRIGFKSSSFKSDDKDCVKVFERTFPSFNVGCSICDSWSGIGWNACPLSGMEGREWSGE
mmetsp:Transcript_15018/g.14375  ORF Transcript_15018/g.14375 Transcript_15018/m.14375 type:complete len:209 (-) Transcript_15018:1982-2608(-)